MSPKLTLSVVDQSPVREGATAGEALWETVQLAKAAEQYGYERYWVAEHHNLANFAAPARRSSSGRSPHTPTLSGWAAAE